METYERAADLPSGWDALCGGNYSMKRDFLAALEKGNPCGQRYHLFRDGAGNIDSAVITYVSPRQNLLTFTPLTMRVRATFVHVPVSITRPGFVIGESTRDEVYSFIGSIKGYVIVLNAPPGMELPRFTRARTSYRLAMAIRWRTFGEYLSGMRSHYRYKNRKIFRAGSGLVFRMLENSRDFSDGLYSLYINVYNRSHVQIERLNAEFFRCARSRILVAYAAGRPAGFVQMIENGDELVFEFVGLDYGFNREYEVYHNLLLKMIEYAIENGFKTLELGQTTEEAKLRLGADYIPLYLLIRHSSPLVNAFLKMSSPLIQYKPVKTPHKVFKE